MKNATGNASRPVPGGTDAAAGSVPARRVGDGAGPGMVRMAGVIHCSCLAFFNLHCVFRILVLEASPCIMVEYKSDIEIARAANKKPIMEIGAKLGIPTEDLVPYGHDKAKVSAGLHRPLQDRPMAS
jgi:hypothetical protein